jgi:hypothetical protein
VLTLGLAAGPALAQSPEQLNQAKTLFNVGAQAFSKGNWTDAVSAFDDAYKLAPRPSVLFSLAQAEKKVYFAEKKPEFARRAIEHYRKYLAEVPSGGRRAEATDAIAELEPIVARLDPVAAAAAGIATPVARPKLYVTAQAEGAQVFLDGKPIGAVPYVGEIEPGTHKVRVSREGYFDVERDVLGDPGRVSSVDVDLPERPAMLLVDCAGACEVYIDGRLAGYAPHTTPIEVSPGPHMVSVVRNGARLYSREVAFERAAPVKFKADMVRSPQRTVAYVSLVGGTVFTLAGALTALTASGKQSEARDVQAELSKGNISPERLVEYNDAVTDRDRFRTSSIVTLSIGAGLLAAGGLLYAFDKPDVAFVPRPSDERSKPNDKPSVELGFAPMLGPGSAGAAAFGRF